MEGVGLKIVLGAEDQVSPVLKQMQDELKRFQQALAIAMKAGDAGAVSTLTKGINVLKREIAAVERAAASPFDKLNKSTKAASNTVLNFGRVIQDLPYAFNNFGSIANNIDPLIESFRRASAEGKGFGGTMKTLLSSLAGGAGIGLAISAVTSAFTMYQMGMFKTKTETEKLAEATEKARKVTEEWKKTLSDIRTANLEGAKNANEELLRLRFLYEASQNVALSITERKKAVNALQDEYPKYFKNINDEIILNGGASASYYRLMGSIMAAARARAQMGKIDTNADAILENNERLVDVDKEWFAARERLAFATAEFNRESTKSASASRQGVADASELVAAQNEVNRLTKVRSELLEDNKRRALSSFEIEKDILATIKSQGVETLLKTGAALPKVPKVKIPKDETQIPITFEKIKTVELNENIKDYINRIKFGLRDQEIPFPKIDYSGIEEMDIDQIIEAMNLIQFNERVTEIMKDTAANMAFAIGDALGSANISGFFDSLFKTIGAGLQEFGKQMILASKLIMGLRASLGTMGGLAAGVALVAVGAVLKNFKVPKLQRGGVIPDGFPNDTFPALLSSRERVVPEKDWKHLMGGLNSGGNNTGFVASTEIHGEKLLLLINRVGRSQGRAF